MARDCELGVWRRVLLRLGAELLPPPPPAAGAGICAAGGSAWAARTGVLSRDGVFEFPALVEAGLLTSRWGAPAPAADFAKFKGRLAPEAEAARAPPRALVLLLSPVVSVAAPPTSTLSFTPA